MLVRGRGLSVGGVAPGPAPNNVGKGRGLRWAECRLLPELICSGLQSSAGVPALVSSGGRRDSVLQVAP